MSTLSDHQREQIEHLKNKLVQKIPRSIFSTSCLAIVENNDSYLAISHRGDWISCHYSPVSLGSNPNIDDLLLCFISLTNQEFVKQYHSIDDPNSKLADGYATSFAFQYIEQHRSRLADELIQAMESALVFL